jgi:basic membrane protein A and related proteins
VKAMAEKTEKALADHALHPFQGPVYKQDGTLAVKQGETLKDPDILSMNWYVKGVDDKVPQ